LKEAAQIEFHPPTTHTQNQPTGRANLEKHQEDRTLCSNTHKRPTGPNTWKDHDDIIIKIKTILRVQV
jgi:hypothetical protein